MNEHLIGFIIVLFTASLPCLILGYLIAFKHKHNLIAGWDAAKFSDANAVGNIIGQAVMFVGVYVLVVTAVWWMLNLSDVAFTLWIFPSAIIYCKLKFVTGGI